MSGSGISWAICKSAPRSRQTTTPVPHHSVFYRPHALPAAQPTASKHWRHKVVINKSLARAKHYGANAVVQTELSLNAVGSRHRWLSGLWMRQEDCSTLWDPQQKMLDGRIWSVWYDIIQMKHREFTVCSWLRWNIQIIVQYLNQLLPVDAYANSDKLCRKVWHWLHTGIFWYHTSNSSITQLAD